MRPRRRTAAGPARHADDWLMTYADIITLLLCVFVALLALHGAEAPDSPASAAPASTAAAPPEPAFPPPPIVIVPPRDAPDASASTWAPARPQIPPATRETAPAGNAAPMSAADTIADPARRTDAGSDVPPTPADARDAAPALLPVTDPPAPHPTLPPIAAAPDLQPVPPMTAALDSQPVAPPSVAQQLPPATGPVLAAASVPEPVTAAAPASASAIPATSIPAQTTAVLAPPIPQAAEPALPAASRPPPPAHRAATEDPPGDRITIFQCSDAAFFASGSATLSDAGEAILRRLLPTLRSAKFAGYRITVEGHTDDQPIRSAQFPSNWELSSARAAAVVRFFIEHGIAAHRLRAAGYADTRPLLPNRDSAGNPIPQNQAKNRRVVVQLEKIDRRQPAGTGP